MRAARLLHCLLLLQNRGRMTSAQLARELEVSPRTILRDVDAMTEAGLPIIVYQGNQGGIELGFSYRMRLTGLAQDEAEALGILLTRPCPELEVIGLGNAGRIAQSKLLESLPETAQRQAAGGAQRFAILPPDIADADPRLAPMATAVRRQQVVRIQAKSSAPQKIHPLRLEFHLDDVFVIDGLDSPAPIPLSDWGDINISSITFDR
ncbi:MAG: HTH domain-containing protein [Pseudomonadota bacterium]